MQLASAAQSGCKKQEQGENERSGGARKERWPSPCVCSPDTKVSSPRNVPCGPRGT